MRVREGGGDGKGNDVPFGYTFRSQQPPDSLRVARHRVRRTSEADLPGDQGFMNRNVQYLGPDESMRQSWVIRDIAKQSVIHTK